MNQINQHHLQALYHGKESSVYRYVNPENNQSSILKVLTKEYPTYTDLARFYLEYDYLKEVDVPGIRKVMQKTRLENRPAILLAEAPGVTLNKYSPLPMDVQAFLPLAIAITEIVRKIHELHFIHKDLKPQNILIDPATKKINVIDFSNATRFSGEQSQLGQPNQLEGTLAYIAPEMTGRMNRRIDQRSDLYALGIIFYELLKGHLPFESPDPLGLIHLHLAKEPDLSGIPAPVDKIIGKLLAKNAEDRYQSAFGLKHDLEQNFELLSRFGSLLVFPLGQKDYSTQFEVSQKLYGRDQEINIINTLLEQTRAGQNQYLLISGYSGVGKTSLVQEIYKPLTLNKGQYIYGKFNQYQRNTPYSAILDALSGKIKQILSSTVEDIVDWKNKINAAVGTNGLLLTEAMPVLKLIIGEQPPLSVIPPSEAQNRFNNTFLSFIHLFTHSDRPLIVFLDDLQWADLGSLDLINTIINDATIRGLMIIGAYRDNEVDANHPLRKSIQQLVAGDGPITEIHLNPLKPEVTNQIVMDTLRSDPVKCADLSALIYQKTQGNPFFINQFLRKLHEEDLIRFDYNTNQWQWEIQVIKAMNITDNVVDLMTEKIQQFNPATQAVLTAAACIGNEFDLNILETILQQSATEIARDLLPAVEEGLIAPLDNNYKYLFIQADSENIQSGINANFHFLHDRIQQAAYQLYDQATLQKLHLSIGRLLLKNTPESEKEHLLFDLINHFDQCLELIHDPVEKLTLITLYFQAGQKAKKSLAHNSAVNYLEQGIRLLPTGAWEDEALYPLTFELHYEATESKYLIGHHQEAEKLMEEMFQHSANPANNVRIYLLQGILFTTLGHFEKALTACQKGLELLGVNYPSSVTPEMIGQGFMEIETLRAGRAIHELEELPTLQDLNYYFPVLMLAIAATPAFYMDKLKWVWNVMELVKLSLKNGNSDLSDMGYGAYGVVNGTMQNYSTGYEWGELAVTLNRKFNKIENRAKVSYLFGEMTLPWKKHYEQTIPYLEEGYKFGLETGDLIYAGFCAIYLGWTPIIMGRPLLSAIEQCENGLKFYQRSNDIHRWMLVVAKQYSFALQGQTLQLDSLSNDQLTEEFILQSCQEQNAMWGLFTYNWAKIALFYRTGEYQRVLDLMPATLQLSHIAQGTLFSVDLTLYHALILVDVIAEHPVQETPELMQTLEQHTTQLKIWSDNCPDNFSHKFLFLEAEKAYKLHGDHALAQNHYDQAIKAANIYKFLGDEALINEKAAHFYAVLGRHKVARAYMSDALRCYAEWGALGVIKFLKTKYPILVDLDVDDLSQTVRRHSAKTSSTRSTRLANLDLNSLIKATTAISGEVVMDKLLRKLSKILLEAAGAERCLIIHGNETTQQFFVEAEGTLLDENWKILHHKPITSSDLVIEVFQYVIRTKETLVIDNASEDERWKNLSYVRENNALSISCIPVLLQSKLTGAIYLENNLLPNAFTPDRVEVLKLLAAQMAISIENALLYRDLEQKVIERTRTIEEQRDIIEQEKQKSDQLLFNILPRATAEELKSSGKVEPKLFEQVSILFTDFQGFSRISEQITPQELIQSLNECFLAFDEIAEKHGMERIKTIGDAYMCAGGIPVPNDHHAYSAVMTAMEIKAFVKKWSDKRQKAGKTVWPVRIGIHTGSVIAGVIGLKKFVYDIWGDAVNVASRMETSGEAGEINISQSTYELIHTKFRCEHRGRLAVKNRGEIDMYYVKEKI